MKAKLSSLALPLNRGLALALCLGLVITLVLAACSGDSPTKSNPDPGPNGGYSSLGNVDVPGEVEIDGFDIVTEDKRVIISGTACGTKDDPVVKVTYSISSPGKLGWISYNGSPLSGSISNDSRCFDPRDGDIDLKIDLKNTEIPCDQEFYINVEAVNKSGKKASREGKPFKKTGSSLCNVGNSSGAELSSSSIASWKFGVPMEGQVYGNISYPLGSGSFVLIDDPDYVPPGGTQGNMVDQPDLKITGGKIRGPVAVCNYEGTSAGTSGDVKPGEIYSSEDKCLGSTPATNTSLSQIEGLGLQPRDYFLIYMDGGSIYLLFFTDGEGGSVSKWPLKYIYWPATDHP